MKHHTARAAAGVDLLGKADKVRAFLLNALHDLQQVGQAAPQAVEAPYDARESLKQRGYRWNVKKEFGPRSWWIDLELNQVEPELRFLEHEIFHRPLDLPMKEITAYDRYALRMAI